MGITLEDIRVARKRIQGIAIQTPLKPAYSLSDKTGRNIWLKMETMQPTGAFKLRGAANAILQLSPAQQQAGVLTMSTGNHGKAIAYVAKKLGIRAVICISEQVPQVKIEGMKKLGVEVRIAGKDQDEADIQARAMAEAEGLRFISAFDDAGVIGARAQSRHLDYPLEWWWVDGRYGYRSQSPEAGSQVDWGEYGRRCGDAS